MIRYEATSNLSYIIDGLGSVGIPFVTGSEELLDSAKTTYNLLFRLYEKYHSLTLRRSINLINLYYCEREIYQLRCIEMSRSQIRKLQRLQEEQRRLWEQRRALDISFSRTKEDFYRTFPNIVSRY